MTTALITPFSLLRYSRELRFYEQQEPYPISRAISSEPPLFDRGDAYGILLTQLMKRLLPKLLQQCRQWRFDKIIAKEIPSTIVYEDDKVLAFRDINPQAPAHVLVIPKFRDGLTQLGKTEPRHAEILGHLLYAVKVVAEKEGIVDGFRVVINNGPEACQSVYHLHLHILGGRQMKWPPG